MRYKLIKDSYLKYKILTFVLFSIYLYKSFDIYPNHVHLSLKSPLDKKSIKFWLYILNNITNDDFYIKVSNCKKSIKLYSTINDNQFFTLTSSLSSSLNRKLFQTLTLCKLSICFFNSFYFKSKYSELNLKLNECILRSNRLTNDYLLKEWINLLNSQSNEKFCLLKTIEQDYVVIFFTIDPCYL